jgi:predicted metal-dependent phosphoesterase TrpH
MILRADLHSHTIYSRDGLTSPQEYVRRCIRRGVNCAAITDHNTTEGAFVIQRLAPFKVIIGEEINTSEGEIIGLFLRETIRRGMTPEDTIRAIREQGGVVVVPHPFDQFRHSVIRREALHRILPLIDVIEGFNARNLAQSANFRALRLGAEHDKPMSCATDAHSPLEVARSYVEMSDFEGPGDFLVSLAQGKIVGRPSSPFVHLLSTYAKMKHRVRRHLRSVPSAVDR